MSSASLAVTLTQTIPLWIGVKKGLSIEKVLEGLPKDSENRSACILVDFPVLVAILVLCAESRKSNSFHKKSSGVTA